MLRLAEFNEVAIRVTEEAADLPLVLHGRSEELRSAVNQLRVGGRQSGTAMIIS